MYLHPLAAGQEPVWVIGKCDLCMWIGTINMCDELVTVHAKVNVQIPVQDIDDFLLARWAGSCITKCTFFTTVNLHGHVCDTAYASAFYICQSFAVSGLFSKYFWGDFGLNCWDFTFILQFWFFSINCGLFQMFDMSFQTILIVSISCGPFEQHSRGQNLWKGFSRLFQVWNIKPWCAYKWFIFETEECFKWPFLNPTQKLLRQRPVGWKFPSQWGPKCAWTGSTNSNDW